MTAGQLRLIQAWRGGLGGWWLVVEYDEDGIEALKAAVPKELRSWDAERGAWWISEQAVEAAISVVPGLRAHLAQGQLL